MAIQADQLRWTAAQVPDEVAYRDASTGRCLTFGDWEHLANTMAGSLRRTGLSAGDRVMLHADGTQVLKWIVAYTAIHRAGLVAVPLNTRLSRPEVARLTTHADPGLVLATTELAALHDGSIPVSRIDDPTTWSELTSGDPGDRALEPGDDDLADIMYTSGTTGLPKGIAVRHRNTHIIANGEPPWSGDRWLVGSPLFTFAGLSFVYNPMKMGMSTIYLPRFDVDAWIDCVETDRPTCAFLVPAMVQLLLASPRFATADLSSLTLVSIGSAPLAPVLHRAMADRLAPASVSNNYSMSEAGTAFTYLPPEEIERRPGSVGLPSGVEIRIVDDDDNLLGPNQVGEVLIGVGAQHREYYRDPEATAATWSGEWLRSGDLGELDEDGYLYIRGRKKDVIIRGGHNVVATDVEAVLYEHPAVLEVAVIGVPHDVLGEDVGAAVVTKPGCTVTDDELREFAAARVADNAIPRRIWFVDHLPRNPTGKVLKRELVLPDG